MSHLFIHNLCHLTLPTSTNPISSCFFAAGVFMYPHPVVVFMNLPTMGVIVNTCRLAPAKGNHTYLCGYHTWKWHADAKGSFTWQGWPMRIHAPSSYEDLGARSRYQGQGKVITSHSIPKSGTQVLIWNYIQVQDKTIFSFWDICCEWPNCSQHNNDNNWRFKYILGHFSP